MKTVRSQFHVAPGDFTVLLLDEDGSVKLRAAAPVNADRLNALIDKRRKGRQRCSGARKLVTKITRATRFS